MKRLALITCALLGAAPLASAQVWHQPPPQGDYDRGFDEGTKEHAQNFDHGYRQQRDAVRLVTMDVTRKQTVDIPRNAGRFQTLRLRAVRSAGYIDFVTVRYGNGQQQHVDVKHVIGRDEDIDINVGGRRVEAITVHGGPNPRDPYARRARIDVIGMR